MSRWECGLLPCWSRAGRPTVGTPRDLLLYHRSDPFVEWGLLVEQQAAQIQPWVPHVGCYCHRLPTHSAEGGKCADYRGGNQPRVPHVGCPHHCVQGKCVQGYHSGEETRMTVEIQCGGQFVYIAMLQEGP